MSVKDGLLALLAEGPKHGYQLKTEFETAVGEMWTLNIGQVYTSLQRLERDGLVELDSEEDDRKSYRLTLAGREQLDEWLVDATPRSSDVRDDVATKVLLARRYEHGDPFAVIEAQRTVTMRALQKVTRDRSAPDIDLAQRIHLDRLALGWRAELDWLDLVEDRLRASTNGHASTTTAGRVADTTTGEHR